MTHNLTIHSPLSTSFQVSSSSCTTLADDKDGSSIMTAAPKAIVAREDLEEAIMGRTAESQLCQVSCWSVDAWRKVKLGFLVGAGSVWGWADSALHSAQTPV